MCFIVMICKCDDHRKDGEKKSNSSREQKEFLSSVNPEVKNKVFIESVEYSVLMKKKTHCPYSNHKSNLQIIKT